MPSSRLSTYRERSPKSTDVETTLDNKKVYDQKNWNWMMIALGIIVSSFLLYHGNNIYHQEQIEEQ
jgi:hypothetical protein